MAGKSSAYVIGCKLPSGLIINGSGQQVKLAGANDSLLINGFGITRDVPADAWDAFAKTFADHLLIKNGLVFAVSDDKSAQAASKELAGQKTGLEQLDPSKQLTKPDKG